MALSRSFSSGATMMVEAIGQVLVDPAFEINTAEAREAREAAVRLSAWLKSESNHAVFESFSTAVYEDIGSLFTSGSGHIRPPISANREKMWRNFFFLRSSNSFIMRWKGFLEAAEVSTTPTFFQHVTDLIFRSMIKTHYRNPSTGAAATTPISPREANALRYAAGYICRHLRNKLKRGRSPDKEELIGCLEQLVQDDRGGDGECEMAGEWTELVDRGGLWKVHDTTFQVFCALEEEVRSSLHTLVLEPTQTYKNKLIGQLVSSADVQFYWCIAAASFDTADEETHSELLKHIVDLFVTVRGFAFASAWVEKHKQSEKKSTQRSKGLRKKIYTDKGH